MAAPIIAIGTGAPLGPEGPSAKIGSGLGSLLCQVLRLPPNDMKMFTAAGAGAAIAAVFNDCVVLDSQLRVEGVISRNTITYLLASGGMADFFIAIDVCEDVPLLVAGDTAFSALEKIDEYDVDTLPVVSSLESREFIGVVTRHEIMKAYHRTLKSRDILKR